MKRMIGANKIKIKYKTIQQQKTYKYQIHGYFQSHIIVQQIHITTNIFNYTHCH
jgi:hypothetical protein